MSAQAAPLESITVGDIEVTYVPDGEASVSAAALFPTASGELWDAHRDLFDADGLLLLSLGAFLIRSGDATMLVDLGFGDLTVSFPAASAEFRSGALLTNLRRAGVAPEDVNGVFYTHLHLDHVGWTSTNGRLTFPNARHLVGAGELEFWQQLDADEPLAAVGPDPQTVLAPLTERADAVADGAALAPGVNVVATPGHTPGHCSLVLSSGADRAIILGDVLHCPIQLTHNDVSMLFDVDPTLGARTRDRIASEIEGDAGVVAAQPHFTGSVFGRIVRGEGRRSWSSGATQITT